jgi:hypothetical protein
MDALGYARIALAAYTSFPTIGREDSASRAILNWTDDGRVLALPGTNNMACVIADIDCEVVHINGLGALHKGFYDASMQIWDSVLLAKPAVLTAHSEGAALSLILAGQLCLAGFPPKAVYAFEPPRVSIDPTLGQLLTAHGVFLFLTRKGKDIVPVLPPDLLDNWQHPAPLRSIGEALEPFDNEDDHAMAGVVAALDPQPQITQLRD